MWWILLTSMVIAEDLPTPASLLGPRHVNHHARQYLEEVSPEPTKQGPVLFPNDAPPPPRPPLIVTSRPLIESIARSELNPIPPEVNNSIASPSQINRVSFKPNYLDYEPNLYQNYQAPNIGPNNFDASSKYAKPFLARVKDYKPYVFPGTAGFGPYNGRKKAEQISRDNGYSDYAENPLPPIYKVIGDHAKQKLLKFKKKVPKHQNYHVNVKDRRHDHGSDYDDDGSNYAFSYTVKDHDTGDDFSHSQQSSGSATNGEYRVRLPDGRMQIVSYTADENGYKADVRYDDEDKTEGNRIDYDYSAKHYEPKHYTKYDDPKHHFDANKYEDKHYDPYTKYDNSEHKYDTNKYDINYEDKYAQNRPNYADINDYQYGQNIHDYSDVNHDYVQNRNYKPVQENYKDKDDFNQYSDLSKEVTDYSAEYDGKHDNYEPHTSKFSSLVNAKSTIGTIVVPSINPQNFVSSTVKPTYDYIKPIFVQKKHQTVSSSTVKPSYEELEPLFVNKNLLNYNPVEINVPSTTPSLNYESTTEHVVIIGTKPLYTNIKSALTTPVTFAPPSTTVVSPRNYLVSTIHNLKNGEKPILSDSFISRINKYLSFN